MLSALTLTAAALTMAAPESMPAPVAAFAASPVGEIALILALVLSAADLAAAFLFPGRRLY